MARFLPAPSGRRPITGIEYFLAWHARHERDAGHRRLRALVGDTPADTAENQYAVIEGAPASDPA